jgi:hypothetical protein
MTSTTELCLSIQTASCHHPSVFLKVPESKTAKNRVHLDVRVPAGGAGDEALREQRIRDKAAQLVAPGEQSGRCTRSTAR